MLIKVNSVSFSGLNTIKIDAEINIAEKGLPTFEIVGLPNKAVAESRERVRTAVNNSGIHFPFKKITVNLAPGDIPKEGAFYDLPIAAGILSFITGFRIPEDSLFFGELSLDGSLRHTKGALLAALFASGCGIKKIFVPSDSANEASIVKNLEVYPIEDLIQLIRFLKSDITIKQAEYNKKEYFEEDTLQSLFDMSEIIGQEQTKRAVEIAAAGGHNILMTGAPGSGKTMLARTLPGILPPLTEEESIEVTKIYSSAGCIPPGGSLIKTRPFRSPHHIISRAGLVGGGIRPQPGEISLAHRGVLFLDEFNEFPRSVIEALRQPLEDGMLTISRSRERITYPSRFILAAAANPCPCGYLNDGTDRCTCSRNDILRYRKKLSGPILDRIDIHIDVPSIDVKKLSILSLSTAENRTSEEIQDKISRTRLIQEERYGKEIIHTNAEMRNRFIKKYSKLSRTAVKMMLEASSGFRLSARAYLKVIKTAQTIADMEEAAEIKEEHIAEALQYRPKYYI